MTSLLRRTLDAIDIDSEFIAGRRRTAVQGNERNAHFPKPDFPISLDTGFHSDSRVPTPRFRFWVVSINIQVHLLALRRNLKFFVLANIVEGRLSTAGHSGSEL